MLIDLSGKVAIVTGAAQGIGREIAMRLAREGAYPVAIDIAAEPLQTLEQELRDQSLPGETALCDITDESQIAQLVSRLGRERGHIDVLVNNAGIFRGGAVESLNQKAWELSFQVNATGTFLMCRAVVSIMKRQGSGRIINAASFAAIVPSLFSAAYAASKAAVVSFTRVLAGELGPWGITVNAYAPGMVPTEMNGFAGRPAAEQERLLDLLTIRRWERAEDVADLICFLASEKASYITGTLIDVSGGKLVTQIPSDARGDSPA